TGILASLASLSTVSHPDSTTGEKAITSTFCWIAVEPGRIHLLTEQKDLVTLDPATGAQRSRFVLNIGRDGTGWQLGRAYAAGGYVAVERARERAVPDDDDQAYFLMAEPVLLAAT
ncbi:PQQ-binding-like beta-propeller repeat protein, partial [Micromonospora sp. NPDC003776]